MEPCINLKAMQWSSIELDRGAHRASARAAYLAWNLFHYFYIAITMLRVFIGETRATFPGERRVTDTSCFLPCYDRHIFVTREWEDVESHTKIQKVSIPRLQISKASTWGARESPPSLSPWQLAQLLIRVIYDELPRTCTCVWLFVIYTWAHRACDGRSTRRGSMESQQGSFDRA